MSKIFTLILFLLISQFTYSQEPILGSRGYSDFNIAPNGFLNTFAPAPEEQKFTAYLYDYWQSANVYLKDSTSLNNLDVKIDVIDNTLDILYNENIKVLPFSELLAFTLPYGEDGAETFLNGESIFGKSHPFRDKLFHVLKEGEVSLYSTSRAEISKAYMNAALAMDVEDKVDIETEYSIIYKDKLIPVGKKSEFKAELASVFGDDVLSLMKKINLRKEDDLVLLVSRLEEWVNNK